MKRITVGLCAVAIVVVLTHAAWADAETLFDEIDKTANTRLSSAGKSRDRFIVEVTAHLEGIVTKCDKYRADYPRGKNLADVLAHQARAYLLLYSVKQEKSSQTKAVALANRILKDYPKSKAAAEGYAVLIESSLSTDDRKKAFKYARTLEKAHPKEPATARTFLTLMRHCVNKSNYAKALEYGNKILTGFPKTDGAPKALYYTYMVYDKTGRDKKATEALEKLVADYGNTREGQYAKKKLGSQKLKGSELELEFTSTTGKRIDIKDYRGNVVLVDFWASWCGPCEGEMPNVVKAEKSLRAKGFRVIGISLDQNRTALDNFVKKFKMPWPQYFDGKGWGNLIARKFGVNSIPQTFLVDKKGKIREIGLRGNALEKAVSKLLDEK